nr:PD-(D/E)XK nuclease family protein [uncultured Draconibacterium sp.]
MKPNIFDISTKELSQDAFITWLLQWADIANETYDKNLNKCGSEFVTTLIKKNHSYFNEQIKNVRAGRQWENIDVWAEVNDKYLIIIEDKTYTKQHSGQLAKYKSIAEKWCEGQKYEKPICVYLKTGNESQQSLKKVIKEGFEIYNRQEFVTLLNNHDLKNDIYNDFKTRLNRIEQLNHKWETKVIKDWNGNDWQGFFQFLENKINLIGWDFVNNQNGGFWNAVLNWHYWDIYPVYLQTEEYKLCFKISTDPDEPVVMPENVTRSGIRNKLSRLILNSAKEKNISTIRRPDRFGNGKYMTVAIVDAENWLGDREKIINKEQVAERLLSYKSFLLETIK